MEGICDQFWRLDLPVEEVARLMLPLGRSPWRPALTATHSRLRLTTTCTSQTAPLCHAFKA